MAFLDEGNHVMPLRQLSRDWRPSELTTAWMAGDLLVSERKCVLPTDVLVSELSIWNPTPHPATVQPVVYSLRLNQPSRGDHLLSDVYFDGATFRCTKRQ